MRVESVKAGGMGTVYICRRLTADEARSTQGASISLYFDGSFQRRLVKESPRVALKSLHRHLQGRGARIASFLREVALWIALPPHPNVVRALEFDEPLLHLEYIDGGDLRERLHAGPLPANEIVHIGTEFCRGMEFLSASAGIVHRDIKPANILLTQAGGVKITDFGLAKALTEPIATADSTTPEVAGARRMIASKLRVIAGTPPYMSPEQYLGVEHLTPASDIYSFGVVLYEMLSGRRPFDAEGVQDLKVMHLEVTPADPASILPAADRRLSAVALKCLQKSPEHRFADFAELGDAIEACDPGRGARVMIPPATISDLEARMTAFDWCIRSRLLQWRNDPTGAFAAAERARLMEPEQAGPRTDMALSLFNLGRSDEALALLEEEAQLFPQNFTPHVGVAEVCHRSRRFEDALAAARKAAAISPDVPVVWHQLTRHGGYADSIQDIGMGGVRLLVGHQTNPNCLYEMVRDAWRMAQARQPAMAAQLFGLAARQFPSSPMAVFNWGVFCHRQGDLGEAHRHYTRAIELDDRSTEAWVLRGWIHVERKEFGLAARDFRSAHAVGGDNDFAALLPQIADSLSKPEPPSESLLRSLQFLRNLALDYYL